MEQLSATSILSLFQTNEQQRSSFVSGVVNDVRDGNASKQDVKKQIEGMRIIIKDLSKCLKEI